MAYAKSEHGITLIREDIGNSFDGGGGDSGGGMSDKLERRIERLEGDLSLTRNDLATLAERTTNLSTKADVGEVKGEL